MTYRAEVIEAIRRVAQLAVNGRSADTVPLIELGVRLGLEAAAARGAEIATYYSGDRRREEAEAVLFVSTSILAIDPASVLKGEG